MAGLFVSNEVYCRYLLVQLYENDNVPQPIFRVLANNINPMNLGDIAKMKIGGKNCKLPSTTYFVKKFLTKDMLPGEPRSNLHYSYVPSLNKEFKKAAVPYRPKDPLSFP